MKPRTRRTASGFRRTSIPAISAVPAVGLSSVARIRSVVVLPAPFGPDEAEDLALGDVEVEAGDRDGARRSA